MTRLMRLTVALLVCAGLFGFLPLAAQESRGSIAGLVVDSSGGALPGVTVTIVNTGTNATAVQTTNEAGQYTAVLLLPGHLHRHGRVERLPEARISEHPGARRRARAARRDARARDGLRIGPRGGREPAARNRQRDDRAGDQLQAHQRNSARGRNRLWPDAAHSRRVVRAVVRAAAADGQRQPSRHDDHRARSTASSRSTDRATSCRRRAPASSRPRTRLRSSRSKPPPTTRRSATPAPVP